MHRKVPKKLIWIWIFFTSWLETEAIELFGFFLALSLVDTIPKVPWFKKWHLTQRTREDWPGIRSGHTFDRILQWWILSKTNCVICNVLNDSFHIIAICLNYANIRENYECFKSHLVDLIGILKIRLISHYRQIIDFHKESVLKFERDLTYC